MNTISLEKATDLIAKTLLDSDIDEIDKVELLINLKQFLKPETYEETIAFLRENEETIKRK